MKKRQWLLMLSSFLFALFFFNVVNVKAESSGTQDMYRLYNPHSGEHFYTANVTERNNLREAGWQYEGIGWVAPAQSDTPVYRLYNANAGDHHYTMSPAERDMLITVGWKYEGIGWYSDDAESVPLYRQYNPNAKAGSHNYTTSKGENDGLVRIGWRGEGIGWYAIEAGSLFPGKSYTYFFDDSSDGYESRSQIYSWKSVYFHFYVDGGDPDGFDNYYCIWTYSDGREPTYCDSMRVYYGEWYWFSVWYTDGAWHPNVTVTANLYNSAGQLVAQDSVLWGA